MNGLRKVQNKGKKVGKFFARKQRLICGRLLMFPDLLPSSCEFIHLGKRFSNLLAKSDDNIIIENNRFGIDKLIL